MQDELCMVCCESRREVRLRCGHSTTCKPCTKKIESQAAANGTPCRCPYCSTVFFPDDYLPSEGDSVWVDPQEDGLRQRLGNLSVPPRPAPAAAPAPAPAAAQPLLPQSPILLFFHGLSFRCRVGLVGFVLMLLWMAYSEYIGIHEASKRGSTLRLLYFRLRGADLDTPDSWGRTPVYLALMADQTRAAEFAANACLARRPPPASGAGEARVARGVWGPTPACLKGKIRFRLAHTAAEQGLLGVLQYMAAHGVEWNESDGEKAPIHTAASAGQAEVLTFLASMGDVDRTNPDGDTPAHLATKGGHLAVLEALQTAKASLDQPNARTKQGPIYWACYFGHLEMVRLLADSGADLSREDSRRFTPVYAAAEKGHAEVLKLLAARRAVLDRPNENGFTPLHIAAAHSHLSAVLFLVGQGVPIDSPDVNDATPIMVAADAGGREIVELLADSGAAIKTNSKLGSLAAVAAAKGHAGVLEVLIPRGDPFDTPDVNGHAPIHHATLYGHLSSVQVLIQAGADAKRADKRGGTLVYMAAERGHLEVLKYLLALPAPSQLVQANINDFTPIHIASEGGHTEVVEHLAKVGADIHRRDVIGRSPLYVAAEKGRLPVLKVLVKWGADPRTRDSKGRSPTDVAEAKGYKGVVAFLHTAGAV